MLVMRVQGGLGNQMFQYAFGQYLAKNRSYEVRYDTSSFATDRLRDHALDAWQIDLPQVETKTLPLFPKRFGGKGYKNLLSAKLPMKRVREKKPYFFHPRYTKVGNHTYLDGYWQNERYFDGMRDTLVNAFRPAKALSKETETVLEHIASTNSVALHVRRTDYLKLPEMQVCDHQYYLEAVKRLLATYSGINLFVFSDDLAWCKEHLAFDCPMHFVDHNCGATAHEDLWLMSRCQYHVIPNSSFSWWAAWLKEDSSKEVFVPSRWFADPKFGGDQIAPQNWIRIGTMNQKVAA